MVERVSCILGALSFNINCKSGLELHCEVVLEYGNLFEPAFYQGFVELGEGGILVFDVILQFIDASNLCISGSSIDGVLLTLFTELENFIGNLIVVMFLAILADTSEIALRIATTSLSLPPESK